MKTIIFLTVILFSVYQSFAQSNIDKILLDIEKNNKEILSEKQYNETKKLEYKTGIFLKNPSVEYDYLFGSPTGTGNQSELLITQEFDFPTVYSKRKKVTDLQVASVETQIKILRNNLLLEAKLYCIEIVYLNKKKTILSKRFENAKSLFDKFDKRLKTGDASILDLNKTKLNLLNSENDLQLNQTRINTVLQKLSGLNGNNPVSLNDTIYPVFESIPDVATLQKSYAENDPLLKTMQSEKEISTAQIALAKSLSLPKIQAGYHSQSNTGINFNGVHLGITIPLWENKNTVKLAKVKVDFNSSQIENRQNLMLSKITEIYGNCISLKKNIDDYTEVLKNFNNLELLDKALQSGQFSAIEYLLELSYFYDTWDKYLQLEFEYNKSATELFKYKL